MVVFRPTLRPVEECTLQMTVSVRHECALSGPVLSDRTCVKAFGLVFLNITSERKKKVAFIYHRS